MFCLTIVKNVSNLVNQGGINWIETKNFYQVIDNFIRNDPVGI